jgi:hypothetical protein
LYDTSVNTSTAYVGDLGQGVNNWTGDQTIPGDYSHAEGHSTIAIGNRSHAEGFGTLAIGTANTNVSGALTVTNGGTGAATLTANGIVYGNGTSLKMIALQANPSDANQAYFNWPAALSGTLALTSDIPSLANYVTLDGGQTISGAKTFSAALTTSSTIASAGDITITKASAASFIANNTSASGKSYRLVSADAGTFVIQNTGVLDLVTITSSGASTFVSTITASNLSGTNTGDQTLTGLGGVPTSRTLTINGTGYDLTANRSWTISAALSGGTENYVARWTSASALGIGKIYDNGTGVSIGEASITAMLSVSDNISSNSTIFRLHNENTTNNEASMRFRAKSSTGINAHADVGVYSTGADTGNFFVKFPYNNSVQTNVKLSIDHNGLTSLFGTLKVKTNAANQSVATIQSTTGNNLFNFISNDASGQAILDLARNTESGTYGSAYIRLRVDGDSWVQGGKFGVGTSSPSYRFHVVDNTANWSSQFRNTAGTETIDTFLSHGGGYGMAIDSTASGDSIYLFKLAGGNGGSGQGANLRFKVAASGKTSINSEINASYYLYVNGATYSTTGQFDQVRLGSDGNYSGYYTLGFGGVSNGSAKIFAPSGATDALYIAGATGHGITMRVNGTSESCKFYSDSNISLGTNGTKVIIGSDATPRAKLELAIPNNSSTNDFIHFGTLNGPAENTGTSFGSGIVWKYWDTGGGYTKRSCGILQLAQGNYLRSGLGFFVNANADTTTDWTCAMVLRDAGNLLLGTESENGFGSARSIQINGSGGGLVETRYNGTSGLRIGSGSDHSYHHDPRNAEMRFATSDSTRFYIYGNGNYDFTGTDVSDRRAKTNISILGMSATDKIMSLVAKTYNMKNNPSQIRYGFIAQEVKEIVSDLVIGDENNGYLGLDYNGLLTLAIKTLQEQQKEIQILKNK